MFHVYKCVQPSKGIVFVTRPGSLWTGDYQKFELHLIYHHQNHRNNECERFCLGFVVHTSDWIYFKKSHLEDSAFCVHSANVKNSLNG